MDKRWQDRFPVMFEVIIDYPALGLLRGHVLNMSNDGMYIATAATAISDYTDIEITICLAELSATPVHIPALVIHNDEQGIGVMFKEKQQKTEEFLQYFDAQLSHHQLRTVC